MDEENTEKQGKPLIEVLSSEVFDTLPPSKPHHFSRDNPNKTIPAITPARIRASRRNLQIANENRRKKQLEAKMKQLESQLIATENELTKMAKGVKDEIKKGIEQGKTEAVAEIQAKFLSDLKRTQQIFVNLVEYAGGEKAIKEWAKYRDVGGKLKNIGEILKLVAPVVTRTIAPEDGPKGGGVTLNFIGLHDSTKTITIQVPQSNLPKEDPKDQLPDPDFPGSMLPGTAKYMGRPDEEENERKKE